MALDKQAGIMQCGPVMHVMHVPRYGDEASAFLPGRTVNVDCSVLTTFKQDLRNGEGYTWRRLRHNKQGGGH